MTSKLRDRQTTVQWTTRNGTQVERFLRDDEDIAHEVRSLQRTHPALAQAKYLEALRYVVEYGRPLTLDEMCTLTGWAKGTAQNRLAAGTFPIKGRRVGKRRVFDVLEVLEYMGIGDR